MKKSRFSFFQTTGTNEIQENILWKKLDKLWAIIAFEEEGTLEVERLQNKRLSSLEVMKWKTVGYFLCHLYI